MIENEIVEKEKTSPINNNTSPRPNASLKLDFSFSFEYKNTTINNIETNMKFMIIEI